MLHQILEANGNLPDRVQVMFANTGREMPETLEFVRECQQRWGVKITWVEYDVVDNRATYKTVSDNSASRIGEPFEVLVKAQVFTEHSRKILHHRTKNTPNEAVFN